MVNRIAIYLLLAYLAMALLVFIFQRRLLYLPSRYTLPLDATSRGLTRWPQADGGYLGFIGGATQDQAKGTVLVFHGNAGSAIDRSYFVDALGQLGFRVILAEYPGYGARSGKPSQKKLVAQAEYMITLVRQSFPGPIYLMGESLGAGVVAATMGEAAPDIEGVVLITPWYTLTDLAQSLYPFLPVRWLIKDSFESGKNLSAYRGPVAVLLAENDEIIPMGHGDKLYHSLSTRKRRWLFEGAGHNSWPAGRHESWWQEVMDFVTETTRKR